MLEEHRRLNEAQAIGCIGGYEWNLEGPILYWSDKMLRLHRLEPQSEDITHERMLSFIHPEDQARVKNEVLWWRSQKVNIQFQHRFAAYAKKIFQVFQWLNKLKEFANRGVGLALCTKNIATARRQHLGSKHAAKRHHHYLPVSNERVNNRSGREVACTVFTSSSKHNLP